MNPKARDIIQRSVANTPLPFAFRATLRYLFVSHSGMSQILEIDDYLHRHGMSDDPN